MNTPNIKISCGPAGGDCTSRYYIYLSKPMTIGEFISEWLQHQPGEWGYFGICKKGEIFGDPCCSYSKGIIKGDNLPEEYLNKTIKKAYGSGGWSRSDFQFEV